MAKAADAAINSALLYGTPPLLVRPKKEVAYVAAITLGGIHEIAAAWAPICAGQGLALRLTGGTQAGFGRVATPSLNTDWSKTVELLLRVTYARAFGDKTILGPTRPRRGTNAIVCFGNKATPISKSELKQTVGFLPPLGGIVDASEREGNGLSVFHFELETGDD